MTKIVCVLFMAPGSKVKVKLITFRWYGWLKLVALTRFDRSGSYLSTDCLYDTLDSENGQLENT